MTGGERAGDQVELAAVVLTKNVAKHIGPCLDTLSFADLVLVADSYSDDGTSEIARQAGAKVMQRAFDNFASYRNATLDAVQAEWVFFVDADERIPDDLAREARRVIREREEVGWWVPRHNFIAGQEVRHGGFYPDCQLRLLRKAQARYDPTRLVHEVVLLDGPAGTLENPMIHYNYDDWNQFHEKQRRYATLEARILRERGVKPWPHKFFTVPFREFRRRYVSLAGYKDGWIGLKLAFLLSFYYGFMPHWNLLRRAS